MSALVLTRVFGVVFVLLLFFPIGVYHYLGEPNITGALYPFQTPFGLVLLIVAAALFFDKRVKKFDASRLLVVSGVLVLLVLLFQTPFLDSSLRFWHGVSGEFDVDYYGSTLHVLAASAALVAGAFLSLKHSRSSRRRSTRGFS